MVLPESSAGLMSKLAYKLQLIILFKMFSREN